MMTGRWKTWLTISFWRLPRALRSHVFVVQPGLILAVHGADFLSSTNMPAWALLTSIILVSSLLNLFVGSASAKWALIAPVMVPMLMLLGITPEMATAAYRVGDGATNIITPLMVYFPLILIFCQRWQSNFGLGSLAPRCCLIPLVSWCLVLR